MTPDRREKQKAYKAKYRKSDKGRAVQKKYMDRYAIGGRNKAIIAEIKTAIPCADCGVIYPPCAMDFDHVRGVKKYGIGQMINMAEELLYEELAKCELVCANCHRVRTRQRKIDAKAAKQLTV